jgi:hypothetical protein
MTRRPGSRFAIGRISGPAAGPNVFRGERDATEREESLELSHVEQRSEQFGNSVGVFGLASVSIASGCLRR